MLIRQQCNKWSNSKHLMYVKEVCSTLTEAQVKLKRVYTSGRKWRGKGIPLFVIFISLTLDRGAYDKIIMF